MPVVRVHRRPGVLIGPVPATGVTFYRTKWTGLGDEARFTLVEDVILTKVWNELKVEKSEGGYVWKRVYGRNTSGNPSWPVGNKAWTGSFTSSRSARPIFFHVSAKGDAGTVHSGSPFFVINVSSDASAVSEQKKLQRVRDAFQLVKRDLIDPPQMVGDDNLQASDFSLDSLEQLFESVSPGWK